MVRTPGRMRVPYFTRSGTVARIEYTHKSGELFLWDDEFREQNSNFAPCPAADIHAGYNLNVIC
jgi:hypothetical protein